MQLTERTVSCRDLRRELHGVMALTLLHLSLHGYALAPRGAAPALAAPRGAAPALAPAARARTPPPRAAESADGMFEGLPEKGLPNIDGTGSFRSLQEYPCDLDVKIIGTNEGPFVTDMVTICAENCGMAEADVKARWRDKGKYRAITLRLHFESAEQVYAVYAAINRDPRVKFKL